MQLANLEEKYHEDVLNTPLKRAVCVWNLPHIRCILHTEWTSTLIYCQLLGGEE